MLSNVRLSPRRFRAARRGATVAEATIARRKAKARTGTRISYTDSEAATTLFVVQRKVRGLRVGHRCVRSTKRTRRAHRHARRCGFYQRVGSFNHLDQAGPVKLRYSGRANGRKLRPGRYRITIQARNTTGQLSAKVKRSFRIVR